MTLFKAVKNLDPLDAAEMCHCNYTICSNETDGPPLGCPNPACHPLEYPGFMSQQVICLSTLNRYMANFSLQSISDVALGELIS